MDLAFEIPETPSLPIPATGKRYAVRRIFCVGRNYESHARELGNAVDREAPIWFSKSPASVCLSGRTVPYPPRTDNCHYEMELVVAIGAPAFRVSVEAAMDAVFGFACGIDMTRRDLQNAAKAKGYPWDNSKNFENAAILGPVTPAASFALAGARITLALNGETRQDASLDEMIWSVPEVIADLSQFHSLAPGDLIFTGTPAGVGAVRPGDRLEGAIDGLEPVAVTFGDPE